MATTINGADYTDWYSNSKVTTSSRIKGKDASQLGMNDFMSLMVAQMTNQDMNNPMDNTSMIAQMAQFSTLQGINTIQQYQLSSYATSYVGKDVVIAKLNSKGDLEEIKGMVEKVTFYNGAPQVVVDGKAYDLHTVMEVVSKTAATEPNNETNPTSDVGDTGNTGNTGDVGDTGNTGDTGDVGDTGNTGDTGDVGGEQ